MNAEAICVPPPGMKAASRAHASSKVPLSF
jgi:hypothetical protein